MYEIDYYIFCFPMYLGSRQRLKEKKPKISVQKVIHKEIFFTMKALKKKNIYKTGEITLQKLVTMQMK